MSYRRKFEDPVCLLKFICAVRKHAHLKRISCRRKPKSDTVRIRYGEFPDTGPVPAFLWPEIPGQILFRCITESSETGTFRPVDIVLLRSHAQVGHTVHIRLRCKVHRKDR